MAVKKKTSSSKPATSPKAAPKKSAPKKSAPKKSATKKSTKPADSKSKPAGAVKKAPAIKLSDAQARVLGAVSQTNEAGYVGTKAEGRILEALLKKKLVKKGKKVAGGASRFLVTRAGAKFVAAPAAAPSAPAAAPSPAAEAPTVPPPAVTA